MALRCAQLEQFFSSWDRHFSGWERYFSSWATNLRGRRLRGQKSEVRSQRSGDSDSKRVRCVKEVVGAFVGGARLAPLYGDLIAVGYDGLRSRRRRKFFARRKTEWSRLVLLNDVGANASLRFST